MPAPAVPDYIPPETWADWCEYREQDVKGGNWSERAQRAFLRQCTRLHEQGYDVPAAIDFAMQAGWLTIYPRDNYKRTKRLPAHSQAKVVDLPTADKKTAQSALQAARGAIKSK